MNQSKTMEQNWNKMQYWEDWVGNLGEWAIASHGRGTRPSGKLVSVITMGDKSIALNLHHM